MKYNRLWLTIKITMNNLISLQERTGTPAFIHQMNFYVDLPYKILYKRRDKFTHEFNECRRIINKLRFENKSIAYFEVVLKKLKDTLFVLNCSIGTKRRYKIRAKQTPKSSVKS